MRSTPRTTPRTSPEAQYNKLLAGSIALQQSYMQRMDELERLNETDEELSGRLQEELEEGQGGQIDDLLHQRVALLRKIEHLRAIEDAFPRVRRVEVPRRDHLWDEISPILRTPQKIDPEEFRLAANPTTLTDSPPLSEQESRAFLEARQALAVEQGYEVRSALDDPGFYISRNGVDFSMKHFELPVPDGIAGDSRITKFGASSGEGSERVIHVRYDGSYDYACTDPVAQREIDRVVAIFG